MKKRMKWGIGVGSILAFLVGCFVSNILISASSESRLKADYQSCVYIGTECINVYRDGKGEQTIVIIPEVDVLVPFIEYRPLMDQLSLEYEVVLIEPFGKGLSDVTTSERSLSQIVSELHSAINLSGVDEPYILMSVGYSNLYALPYLYQYQDEVSMYVTIDPNVPNQIDHMKYSPVSKTTSVVRTMGWARLAKVMMPEVLSPSKYSDAYSTTQMNTMMEVAALKLGNSNIIEESQAINDVMKELHGMTPPTSIPTLAFIPTYDIDMYDWWLPEMQSFFQESDNCKISVSRAFQFMHRTNYHEIYVDLGRFMEELYGEKEVEE